MQRRHQSILMAVAASEIEVCFFFCVRALGSRVELTIHLLVGDEKVYIYIQSLFDRLTPRSMIPTILTDSLYGLC